MSKLPVLSGRECAKALSKIDFLFIRQEGSHMIYRRDNPFTQVVIPDHKILDRGTLRAIIRQVGISPENFLELLD
jgi:predicted RNA binding protein YcfA (HicA-like mRNA interferase family)